MPRHATITSFKSWPDITNEEPKARVIEAIAKL